jgi:hypothetical protein
MIQINATTHTKSGLTISTGSILDVKPHFLDTIKVYDSNGDFEKRIYPISFDVKIYKNLETYKEENSIPIFSGEMVEYNVGYLNSDVDIESLTSVDGLLGLLATHIENGDENFSGVGEGNTEIVYP